MYGPVNANKDGGSRFETSVTLPDPAIQNVNDLKKAFADAHSKSVKGA